MSEKSKNIKPDTEGLTRPRQNDNAVANNGNTTGFERSAMDQGT